MLRLTLADQTFELLNQRGLFWFEQRTLIVGDPLFGKGTVFPHRDVPFSSTAKSSALNRLTTLLNFFEPDLLLILGDLVEPAEMNNEELREGLMFWRQQFADVDFFRIHTGPDSPPEFLFEMHMKESRQNHQLAPFEFQAERGETNGFAISARPHSSIKFLDRREGMGIKAPCFHLQSRALMLPGFCSTIQAKAIVPAEGDRVFVVGPNEVVELPLALTLGGDTD